MYWPFARFLPIILRTYLFQYSEANNKPAAEDPLADAISKLGKNAKTRYLTAKLRVLETENSTLRNDLRDAVSAAFYSFLLSVVK